PPLVPMFHTIRSADLVVPTLPTSNKPAAPVEYDVALPLLSAPRFLCSGIDDVPPPVAFSVPADAVALARRKVAECGARLNVGVCWHSASISRQLPLDVFRPLTGVPG